MFDSELGSAIARAKKQALLPVVAKLLDTFVNEDGTISELLDAIGTVLWYKAEATKSEHWRECVGYLEEATGEARAAEQQERAEHTIRRALELAEQRERQRVHALKNGKWEAPSNCSCMDHRR